MLEGNPFSPLSLCSGSLQTRSGQWKNPDSNCCLPGDREVEPVRRAREEKQTQTSARTAQSSNCVVLLIRNMHLYPLCQWGRQCNGLTLLALLCYRIVLLYYCTLQYKVPEVTIVEIWHYIKYIALNWIEYCGHMWNYVQIISKNVILGIYDPCLVTVWNISSWVLQEK